MKRVRSLVTLMVATAALTGCADLLGTKEKAFTIKFGSKGPAGSASAPAAPPAFGPAATQQQLVLTGSNGTLTITDIRIIVEEFELERVETAECDVDPKPAGCEDFEKGPFFVDVPLGGSPVTVVSEDIPSGSYKELEFKVDDLEVDSGEDAAKVQQVVTQVRAAFPDWPDKASMVVVGSFMPTDGAARSFRVYFEAEIEVELEFKPPLEITDVNRSVAINLLPEIWFKNADGTVDDLSQSHFPTTGKLVEFELEIEDGIELEIEKG